uniref:Beta-ketoacyl synthase-like N-terminal domain-containing protein n=1 Tax=Timema genevievae TaxID=629358 RepID=A0A7R9JZN0_TIMGE|nr:unnamed protein product [Timema genevievae]
MERENQEEGVLVLLRLQIVEACLSLEQKLQDNWDMIQLIAFSVDCSDAAVKFHISSHIIRGSCQLLSTTHRLIMPKNKKEEISDDDVVISGMAGIFPEALNVNELKEKLFNNSEFIKVREDSNWNRENLEIPRRLGTITRHDKFDASFFGVHKKQCNSLDSLMRNILERSFEAVVDAEGWGITTSFRFVIYSCLALFCRPAKLASGCNTVQTHYQIGGCDTGKTHYHIGGCNTCFEEGGVRAKVKMGYRGCKLFGGHTHRYAAVRRASCSVFLPIPREEHPTPINKYKTPTPRPNPTLTKTH